MLVKVYDFAPLFQIAFGLNIAVPFFPEATNRVSVRTRQGIDNLLGLQRLVPEDERGEYLGEVARVEQDYTAKTGDITRMADRSSFALLTVAGWTFAIIFYAAQRPDLQVAIETMYGLMISCVLPPIVAILIIFLYSSYKCSLIRSSTRDIYEEYIEKS